MVQHIGSFGPKLQVQTFAEFRVFEERRVPTKRSGADDRTRAGIPGSYALGGGERQRLKCRTIDQTCCSA